MKNQAITLKNGLSIDIYPPDSTLKINKLEIKTSVPTPVLETSSKHFTFSRGLSHDIKTKPSSGTEHDISIDTREAPLGSQNHLPLPLLSPIELSGPTSMILNRNNSMATAKTPSRAQSYAKIPGETAVNNTGDSNTRHNIKPVTSAWKPPIDRRLNTERPEISRDYSDTTGVVMPEIKTARNISSVTSKFYQLKTGSSQQPFDRWMTEDFEESVYVKNPMITEQGSKMYKTKVSALNLAELRKSYYGTSKQDYSKTDRPFGTQLSSPTNQYTSQTSTAKYEGDFFLTRVTQNSDDEKEPEENKYKTVTEAAHPLLELLDGQANHFYLQKLTFVYFSINVIGKNSPLTISIQGAKNIKRMKLFVSATRKKPTKLNCDTEFDSRVFKLYEKDRNSSTFLNNYFYLGLFPNDSGNVSIRVEFAPTKPAAVYNRNKYDGKRSLKKKIERYDSFSNMEKRDIYYEIEQIRKERKAKMLLLSQGVDIVELNKDVKRFIPTQATERREYLKQKSEHLIKTVIARKNVIQQEKMSLKKANVMKHDLQKMIKDIAAEKTRQAFRTRLFVQTWFTNIFISKMGDSLRKILEYEKIVRAKKKRQDSIINSFLGGIRRGLMRKGDTERERFKFDIRIALQFQANLVLKIREQEVKTVAVMFLEEISRIQLLKNKFTTALKSIYKVQKGFKNYIQKKEGFRSCMMVLWEKNHAKILEEVMHANPTTSPNYKPNKPMLQRQTSLEFGVEAARLRFFRAWFNKCLARYRKNYEIHQAEVDKLSPEDKQQWKMQNMFDPQKVQKKPNRSRMRNGVRLSLIEQFQKNMLTKRDYSKEDVTHQDRLVPPKLFVLPNQEELEETLREVLSGLPLQKGIKTFSFLE